jgi:hypothetical protein
VVEVAAIHKHHNAFHFYLPMKKPAVAEARAGA